MKKFLLGLLSFLITASVFSGTLFILWSLPHSQPLGHDEAVYLTKARSWIEGTPADQYGLHRPIGMAIFGWIFLHLGSTEQILRSFGVLFGGITVLFAYLLFKRITNIWVAITVVVVLVSSHVFLQQAPLFQNDVPSSGFLIGALWLLYRHFDTKGKSRSIYLVAPLIALAFYVRYGTATALGIITLLTLAILIPKFSKNGYVNYSKLQTTFLITFILFIPHLLESFFIKKDLLGILILSGKVAGREYLGEGLVNYVKRFPYEVGGLALGITAVIGIIATIVIILKRNLRQNFASLLWIGSIGILNFIVIGLLVHSEPRYIFFSMVLLSGVGIASIYYVVRNQPKIIFITIFLIFNINIIMFGINTYNETVFFFKSKETNRYLVAYVNVSKAILNDSSSKGCVIWAISTCLPVFSWYSKCNTVPITNVATFEKDSLAYSEKAHYSIVLAKLNEAQINLDEAEEYGINLTEVTRTDNLTYGDYGDIIVYRLTKKGLATEEDNDWINW
jgi:hypothetical protein